MQNGASVRLNPRPRRRVPHATPLPLPAHPLYTPLNKRKPRGPSWPRPPLAGLASRVERNRNILAAVYLSHDDPIRPQVFTQRWATKVDVYMPSALARSRNISKLDLTGGTLWPSRNFNFFLFFLPYCFIASRGYQSK